MTITTKTSNTPSQFDVSDRLSKKRIAIIGSGVAGLSAAYYLDKHTKAQVHVFEADNKPGGHVHTVDVPSSEKRQSVANAKSLAIDTGFIVCNDRTYPNFLRLLKELHVDIQDSEMSFSVRNDCLKGGFEYNGHNLNTLLAQRKNILNPKFWQFCRDILRFNKDVQLAALSSDTLTIGTYLKQVELDGKGYGTLFVDNYLLPMISAIWSMGADESKDFPLAFFVKFFTNHGLLSLKHRPQWYTIKGGSKTYVQSLLSKFCGELHLSTPVVAVSRSEKGVNLVYQTATGETHESVFDEVIFACHADTALKLLSDTTPTERAVLECFAFTSNTAVLHTDTSLLPKRRRAWASWNYRIIDDAQGTGSKPVLTYNMNILQRFNTEQTYLVSLNQPIGDAHIIKVIDYSHPVYNTQMLTAQARWHDISASQHNGGRTHFCGAYWFNGFHEDGVKSGLRVCQSLGVPVKVLDTSGNLTVGDV